MLSTVIMIALKQKLFFGTAIKLHLISLFIVHWRKLDCVNFVRRPSTIETTQQSVASRDAQFLIRDLR